VTCGIDIVIEINDDAVFKDNWEIHLLLCAKEHPTYIRGYAVSLYRNEDPSHIGLGWSAYGYSEGRGFLALRLVFMEETDWVKVHLEALRNMTTWTDVESEVNPITATLGGVTKECYEATLMGYFDDTEHQQFKVALELYSVLEKQNENRLS
jgi:hypothetical protein